ncbi:hypothetical protein FGG08_006855 [Glutinoglossum americanum]|uniref:Uncharacterized protein n=1 Tax=Glutinoglossum americanum TaxID=1670608 RepID=A0A9P8HRV2_9PEZI|nr:hypothetical protein FGG08_006855 [Glutinoglossum americanum]
MARKFLNAESFRDLLPLPLGRRLAIVVVARCDVTPPSNSLEPSTSKCLRVALTSRVLTAARELQAWKAREEEVQAQKERDELQRQQHKEEEAELKRAAAAARQEKREQLADEKAQKRAQKEKARQQRLVNLQLSNEQKLQLRTGGRSSKSLNAKPLLVAAILRLLRGRWL